MAFLSLLKARNEALFYFGLICLVAVLVFMLLARWNAPQIMGTNGWYKPIKFALSIGIFSWTMGWFTHELGPTPLLRGYDWAVILLLGFELVYIAFQAGRGQLSHYNLSSPLYAALYVGMALAATVVTIWTAYVGVLFFTIPTPHLPTAYLWAIRIGIFLFVIFSLEGFVMGSRLTHTIGGADGGPGLPFLNWSLFHGDPRIPHFIGMHALQVLPLLAFYLLRDVRLTFIAGGIYSLLAVLVLIQALHGRPLIKGKTPPRPGITQVDAT